MSPQKLALTLSLGISIGIVPVLGINTVLFTVLALAFRLNLPAIQLVNWVVYPVQLLLFIPFLNIGYDLFGSPDNYIDLSNIVTLFRTKFWATFKSIWQINLMALAVWAIVAIPLGTIIYYISLSFFNKKKQKMELKAG